MKKYKFKSSVLNLLNLFNIISKINNKRIICGILDQIIQNTQNIFWTVVCLKFIINCINTNKSFSYYLISFSIFTLFFIVSDIFLSWYQTSLKPINNIKLQTEIEKNIFKKISELDTTYYESNDFYNKYIFIVKNIQDKFLSIIDNFNEIIGSIFMCIIVTIVMAEMNKKSIALLIIPLISTFFIQNNLNKQIFKYTKKLSLNFKKILYLNRCFSLSDYALELRTTKIYNLLINKRRQVSSEINKLTGQYGIKISFTRFINDLFRNRIPYSTVLLYALYCATISNEIDVSEISVMLLGLVNLSDTINMVTNKIMDLLDNSRYVDYYNDFLKIKSNINSLKSKTEFSRFNNKIEIKSLSFKYSNSDNYALKDINMNIKKGDKIVILGLNGSGKSTFLKLLLRMYDPEYGSISIDGTNIKKLNIENYRRYFSTLFQDFKLFRNLSISENVLCKYVTNDDMANLNSSITFSGLNEKFSDSNSLLNLKLSKELDKDGISFSGGELQKLAISRTYARNADIVIFDEPTAAIDPISENELLEKIFNLPNDKTVILIIHRLSFAKYADNIFVFNHGEIIEEGNHEQLMNLKGAYANMYNKQSLNYRIGVQVND